jgi:hypothetical protein
MRRQDHDDRDVSPPQPAQQQGRDQPGDNARERLAVEHGDPDPEARGIDRDEPSHQCRHGLGAYRDPHRHRIDLDRRPFMGDGNDSFRDFTYPSAGVG